MFFLFYLSFIDGTYVNVPLKFSTPTVVTDKQVYSREDPIAIRWNYCKGVDTVSDISITLTDGIIYFLPPIKSNRPMGCYNDFTVVAEIPAVIPAGEYKLKGVVHFRVNIIKDIDYTVESNVFYIGGNNDLQNQIDKNSESIQDLEDVNTLEGR